MNKVANIIKILYNLVKTYIYSWQVIDKADNA